MSETVDKDNMSLSLFVEVLDEVVDYDDIIKIVPNMTYSEVDNLIKRLWVLVGGVDSEETEETIEALKLSVKDTKFTELKANN